jgi:hypothetical protein
VPESTEADRVDGRTIARIALVIFAVIVATLVLLSGLARYYRLQHPEVSGVYPVPTPPRIDPAPRTELQRYLAEQRIRLESYAWVDRERGLVHIPIERAMALYAAEAARGNQPRGAP